VADDGGDQHGQGNRLVIAIIIMMIIVTPLVPPSAPA
jgi:hypothetical protein